MAELARITIGFDGGQALSLKVPPKALEGLLKKVGGDGWYDIEADDGAVRIDLARVVYVRSESGEHRVGFSL